MGKGLDEAIKELDGLWSYNGFEERVKKLENEGKSAAPFTSKFDSVWKASRDLAEIIQKEIQEQKQMGASAEGDIRKLYELHRRLKVLILSMKAKA